MEASGSMVMCALGEEGSSRLAAGGRALTMPRMMAARRGGNSGGACCERSSPLLSPPSSLLTPMLILGLLLTLWGGAACGYRRLVQSYWKPRLAQRRRPSTRALGRGRKLSGPGPMASYRCFSRAHTPCTSAGVRLVLLGAAGALSSA